MAFICALTRAFYEPCGDTVVLSWGFLVTLRTVFLFTSSAQRSSFPSWDGEDPPPHPVPHQRILEVREGTSLGPLRPSPQVGDTAVVEGEGHLLCSRRAQVALPALSVWPAFPSGVNEVDYSRYPARETQLQWLLYYLQAQKGTAVTPREVERLYVQVNKFALVSAYNWEGAEEGEPPASHSEPRTSRKVV